MNVIPHIIDGQETKSASGLRFASADPWTREPWGEIALGGSEDADRAVRAARRAFDEGPWPRMGFAERGTLLMLESWKVALALAWGNTVVLKPAEDSPASATPMARLALEAGLPPGVLNVLHGYGPGSAGAALTEHPGVDRITFTGESATGRVIARAAAANLVPVSLELGGKGANIVFDDAGLGNAIDWSIRAIFSNAGQVCLAGSRLYVQRGSYAEFTDRFVAAAQALVAGDPKQEPTQLGPLASEEHYKKVRSYLDGIEADGGIIRTGGLGEGWVVLPTVVENAPPTARICREEVFGPVVTITPFDTDDEAIALANDTRYGLNAMVFTENLSRAHRAAAALKAGTV